MRGLTVLLVVTAVAISAAKPSELQTLLQKLEGEVKRGGRGGENSAGGRGGPGGRGEGSRGSQGSQEVQGFYAFLGEDFLQTVNEQCGIDLNAEEVDWTPVDGAAVTGAMTGIKDLAGQLTSLADAHTQEITDLTTGLADSAADPQGFIQQHGDLMTNFAGTVEQMEVTGMCALAKLIPLRTRMELVGVSGFTTSSKCNRAGMAMMGLIQENGWGNWEAISAALLADLDSVGLFLRQDVECLIKDIRDYQNFVDMIEITGDFSARQAMLTIDGLIGYLMDIGMDTQHLMEAAKGVGELLGYVDEEGATEKTELRNKLKKLVRMIEDMKR